MADRESSWRKKDAPRRASWKGESSANDDQQRHEWQEKTGAPDWAKVNSRRLIRNGLVTFSILCLVGIFLWYVFWFTRPTPLIMASITYYPAPMPPNSCALEDVELIQHRWPDWLGEKESRRSNLRWIGGSVDWHKEDEVKLNLQKQLELVNPGGPGRNVVLIYISGHGMLDGQGEPCVMLVPQNSGRDSWQPDRFVLPCVTLRALLETVVASHPGAKKVVFLDCNRIDTDWKLGVLYNGFADRLEDVVKTADGGKDELIVVNSCGPTQVGWASSEKLGASVFGYFVCQGLAGEASEDGNTVKLLELRDYLRKKVSGWVRQHHQELQEPHLFPADAQDFRLAWIDKKPAEEAAGESATAGAGNWGKVEELWTTHDELRPWGGKPGLDGRQRRDALSWEAFQQQLMRYEQVANAGKAYKTDADQLGITLEEFAKAIKSARQADAFSAYSLPLIAQWNSAGGQVAENRQRVEQALTVTPKETDEKQPVAEVPYGARAQFAWDWLRNRGKSVKVPNDISRVLGTVGLSGPKSGLEPVELHFLRLLTDPHSHATFPQEVNGGDLVLAALNCRDAAEGAASCGADERTQYFVRGLIDLADDTRRRAEDLLFVGNPTDLQEAQQLWTEAAKKYDEAQSQSRELARAFDVRDRAFAELPYYAQWIERRRDLSTVELDPLMKECVEAIDNNHRLAAEIEDALETVRRPKAAGLSVGVPQQVEEIKKTTKTVLDGLTALHDSFDTAIQTNVQKLADAENLRDIADLLSVPLLSGRQRNSLRKAYINIPLLQQNNSVLIAPPPDDKATKKRLSRLAQWRDRHPAVAILDDKYRNANGGAAEATPAAASSQDRSGKVTSDPDQKTIKELADDGAQIYKAIKAVRKELEDGPPPTANAATDPALRALRSRFDRLARGASALLTLPDRYRMTEDKLNDPIGRLLRFDLHELLVWHGQRGIEDFWGDATPTGSKYFDALATGYLDSARRQEPLSNEPEQRLALTLDVRRKAAAEIVKGKIEDAPLTEGTREFRTKLESVPAEGLPHGIIACFPLDAIGHTARWKEKDEAEFVWRQPFKVVADSSAGETGERIFEIPKESAPATDSTWNLVSWYRGNVVERGFRVSLTGPSREVVFLKPAQRFPPTIQVLGDAERAGAIAFVLDCSGSMTDRVEGGTDTRMKLAKDALEQVLQELADVDGYNVSLWLYGHRRGFNGTPGIGPYRMIWNSAKHDDFSVTYKEDVELVWPSTRFDEGAKKKLFNEVLHTDRVQANGCTPLYLSMKRAVEEDLAHQEPNAPRRLVVITDGCDEVYDVTPEAGKRQYTNFDFGPRKNSLNVAELIKAFEQNSQHPIKLTALLCDLNQTEPNRKDAVAGFQNLITNSLRGDWYNVNVTTASQNGQGDLLDYLKSAVGPTRFAVQRLSGNRPASEKALEKALNQQLTVETAPRRDYLVTVPRTQPLAKAKVAIEGEEALLLKLNTAEATLTHSRYDPDPPADPSYKSEDNPNQNFDGKDPDFNPEKFYLAAHTPEMSGDTVLFPISIQNGNSRRFSPRPAEVWVQIAPVFKRGFVAEDKSLPYLFYDLDLKPKTPVPVAMCQARSWPADADQAEIQIWFKLEKTTPKKSGVIEELVRPDEKPVPQLDILTPGGHKVQFSVQVVQLDAPNRGSQIIVTEKHDPDDRDPFPVKVEIVRSADDSRVADEIRHEFLANGKVIRHTFTYKGLGVAALRTQVLEITTREDLQKDAIRSNQPLKVRILRRQL